MIPALRSEFRKLLTTRSTYIISIIFLGLSAFVDFYARGYKDTISQQAMFTSSDPIMQAQSALFVASSITQIATLISVAGALIGLLLMANEYRYNTIMYTLTAVNRRSKVLAAKIIAVMTYVLIFSVVSTTICLALIWAGAALAGHGLPHQNIDLLIFFAKTVFFAEAFALSGMLFAALVRNQVGSIAALFILPNTIESLLSLLLKHNSVYLPFLALSQVIQAPVIGASHQESSPLGTLSASSGALVFTGYLVFGWIVAWILFLRRDAN
jgi:ABC-type transport system involved in multi-copper enzyme maturation permease subunit